MLVRKNKLKLHHEFPLTSLLPSELREAPDKLSKMAYLAPIHRPTSVRHAIKLQFLQPDEDCLVVAYAHKLPFFKVYLLTDRITAGRIDSISTITQQMASHYTPRGVSTAR